MTITVLLVALAHGLPVYFLGLITGSRLVLTIAAAVATLIAIGTGAASYLVFDLAAIAAAYYFGYSHIRPRKPPTEQKHVSPSPSDSRSSGTSSLLVGVVALVVVGFVVYNKYTEKPSPPPPSISLRLEGLASSLRNEKFDVRFPLVQARVQDNSMHVSFRSADQTAAQVTKKFAKTNFAREYAAHYCSSRVSGPLLGEGARIVVSLSGSDTKPIGTYEITKGSCEALTASPPTPEKRTATPLAKVSPPPSAATPSFDVVSRCFFVYAPIAQVGRDRPHSELFQFGQPRVAWIGGFVQAQKTNATFKQTFEANLALNKQAGIRIEEALVQALDAGDSARFSWAINEAVSCDRLIGIRTDFLPRL